MLKFDDIQEGDTLRFTKSDETSPGFYGVIFKVLKKYMLSGARPRIDIELITPTKYSTLEAGAQIIGVAFSETRFERVHANPSYLLFS
jgi:hypothetical protein